MVKLHIKQPGEAGRENNSTLAACNAAGRALDPLIIFTGKNFQSTWRGKKTLPNTTYGVSQNGWMDTEIFYQWFVEFTKQVEERPLLLIYDGHLSHISIKLIEKAIHEDISLMKLPPHVTDKLQPLDVCGFGPLKREWMTLLNERINVLGPRETITKPVFSDLLCSVWHKSLSPENIRSGFRATGIYPLDRSKYPTDRYDPRLVKRYEQWVQLGKPEDIMEELATSISTPMKFKPIPTEKEIEHHRTATSTTVQPTSTPITSELVATNSAAPSSSAPTNFPNCSCEVCMQIGPKPPAYPGKEWVPAWALQDLSVSRNKSFEELVLDKIKGPQDKAPVKRKKIDKKTKVITDKEYLEELKKIEKEKDKKRPSTKKTAKKKIAFADDEEDVDFDELNQEEEIDESSIEGGEDEENSSDADNSDGENEQRTEADESSEENRLLKFWKLLDPPILEEKVINKWYGCIFFAKRKAQLYVGKATRRFLTDVDGHTSGIELNCLKPHVGSDTILESVPSHLPADIDVFPLHNIIDGPLEIIPLKSHKWNVPAYESLKRKFEMSITVDREALRAANTALQT